MSMVSVMMVCILVRRYVNVEIAVAMSMSMIVINRLYDNGHRMQLWGMIAHPSKR
ncbi:hypothetical protein [Rhizobium sp. PL01]|uniref:hypothetical protein n=1 Tax=Rhizobium sp. PL01 TaxID=3085631 RepID=UPI00298194F1|nr:hypothetical protein [Rhizobium sp. PL01]MDW5316172.1 hypothetical protein [Rhizobium sp. PL01]